MKRVICFLLITAWLLAMLSCIPASAANSIVLGVNAIDAGELEGQAMIITPKKAKAVAAGSTSLSWWRSVTFDWSDAFDAYFVCSVSTTVDGTNGKNNYVPENGFVLICNMGNNYGNVNYVNKLATNTFDSIEKLQVGDLAYLTGIDLAKQTIDANDEKHWLSGYVSNAKIYINEKPEGEIYRPDTKLPRLASPVVSCEDSAYPSKEFKVSWAPVDHAEYYIVNVNQSTSVPDGYIIVNNQKCTSCSLTVPSAKMTTGNHYTVSVAAYGSGYRSSEYSKISFTAYSDRSVNSPVKGKKIVAFGDSVTAFTGWVSMLTGELGTEVINAGVGGNKTSDAMQRIKKDVLAQNPDIVIMLFGFNDQAVTISTGKPLTSEVLFEKNYRKMINLLHENGADIVLLTGHDICTDNGYYVKGQYGLDYGTGLLSTYYDIIRKLADEYNLNLIDMNSIMHEENASMRNICMYSDGIHLSNNGHAYYCEKISDYFYTQYTEREFKPDADHAPKEESVPAEKSATESQQVPAEETAAESSTGENQESSGVNWLLIVFIAVVILAGALLFFLFRKK